MEVVEILDRIKSGEDSQTQFKERLANANSLAQEFVAFSNASGGVLIVGVSDNGEILGLDESQIRKYNQLISNASNENVRPPIYPLAEIITINDKKLIIISVKNGDSKPYQTSDGLYLTKSGSDKRKISTEELRRLFSISGRIFY